MNIKQRIFACCIAVSMVSNSSIISYCQEPSLKEAIDVMKNKEIRPFTFGKKGAFYYQDGKLVEEKTEAYQGLKFLYGTTLGKVFRILVRQPFISKLYALWQNSYFSKGAIQPFIKKHSVDMTEFIVPADGYASFNDFFIRKLKPGKRAIDHDEKSVISPCDSKVFIISNVSEQMHFLVKKKQFTLEAFLKNKSLASFYKDGLLMIFRLAPYNYHRFHFPVDCVPSEPLFINGKLESVNPLVYQAGVLPLMENERHLFLLKTDTMDSIAMAPIGATFVGSIINTFLPYEKIKKGEEAGYFAFGGSSIALLFRKGVIVPRSDLVAHSLQGYETAVRVGECIARLDQGAA